MTMYKVYFGIDVFKSAAVIEFGRLNRLSIRVPASQIN